MKKPSTARIKDWIAVFLIHLVLTLPFYTASVYATPSNESAEVGDGIEGIRSISVKGTDGIEGFARSKDTITFNVHAFLNNDTITNNQVVLGSAPGIKFDKCSPSITSGVDCTLKLSSNSTEPIETQPFTINLYRDDSTLADSSSGLLIVDNKAPQVALSISKKRFSSQDSIVVDYDATDFACDNEACNGKCAGIKNIDFFTLDGSFKQTVDVATEDCSVKSSISIEPKKFSEGQNSLFAKASDKFGQASQESSVTFDTDISSPAILPNSFEITRNGKSLNTFSLNKVPVEVKVNISGNDLDLNSVKADLSSLNPSQNLKNAKASCESVDENLSVCTWAIELNPKTAGTKNILVSASDSSGNKENITISKILSLDDKGPVVKSLSTTTLSGDTVLAKQSGNTVIAVFDETTGLSAEDVFLDIGDSKINPTNCNKEKETNWVCVWENVDFSSSAKMSISSETTDVLLNPVSEAKTTEVTIDSQAPVLASISIIPVGGLSQAFPGFFKIGDKIAVIANLTEDNDVFAVADFSKFINGADNVTGSCQRIEADEHICVWQTDSINLQSSGVITFKFSDSAGNELIAERQLKTFGLVNATVPDFWENKVVCSPKTIDRSLGTLINQRAFCQVILEPKSKTKKVSTVFISQADCTSDKQIVDSFETFNTETGSISPIIKITLKKDELQIDNANISCALSIFSKVGADSSITKNPEIENVKINLAFFNMPLGEVSDEVQRKINDAIDDANGILKLIGTLNKLMFYAKKICQIINTLYTIAAILYIAFFVLKITEKTCQLTILGEIYGVCTAIYSLAGGECGTSEGASQTADKSKNILDKFCDYANCKQTILWGPAVKNWINNYPTSVLSPGQNVGPKTEVEGSGFFGQKVLNVKDKDGNRPLSRSVSEYMDPQHNLLVATLFVCVPGIIYGLDKYRQIKCLYADCLQNAVGKEGLPITACEDQKAYAACKYITGELFALFPWTAVFDHFMGLIKNALSNPFTALGVAVSLACPFACYIPRDGGIGYQLCKGARFFALVGDAAKNVQDIIDNGFTIRQDYCARLNEGTQQTNSTEPKVKTSKESSPAPINDPKKK